MPIGIIYGLFGVIAWLGLMLTVLVFFILLLVRGYQRTMSYIVTARFPYVQQPRGATVAQAKDDKDLRSALKELGADVKPGQDATSAVLSFLNSEQTGKVAPRREVPK